METWSKEAGLIMREIGWFPGRKVDTTLWRDAFTEFGLLPTVGVERFLSEYGGLVCSNSGSGVKTAKQSFGLNPLLTRDEEDRFVEWGEEVGKSIFPLGDIDGGTAFLGVDEDEVIYLVADWLATFGKGQDGLNSLILGIAPRTLFR